LEVAQWFLSIKPTIDISAKNEYAFRYACEKGHLEVAQWLQSLNPDKYYFTVEHGKITNWEVRVSLPIHPSETISLQEVPEEDRICVICQETQVEIQTNCSHKFCNECIQKWYNADRQSCPYCRQIITKCIYII